MKVKKVLLTATIATSLIFCTTSCGKQKAEVVPTEAPIPTATAAISTPTVAPVATAVSSADFDTLKEDFQSDMDEAYDLINKASGIRSASDLQELTADFTQVKFSISKTLSELKKAAKTDAQKEIADSAEKVVNIMNNIQTEVKNLDTSDMQGLLKAYNNIVSEFKNAKSAWSESNK